MEELIPKIDRALLKKELTRDKFVKETNFGKNEVYIIDEQSAPNVLREIGRLREVSFRAAGGGTGKSLDLDRYDIGEHAFKQLLVWNPADEDIVGGYRFVHCKELPIDEQGQVQTPTSKLFRYSKKFIREYIPVTIELGRSFVQPEYQPARNMRKGIYSLDNLWDGLGAVATKNTDVEYFFGKITMYAHSDLLAREAIVYFLKKYFPDPDKLVVPHDPVELKTPEEVFEKIFTGKSYEENFKLLQQYVRSHNENIPPLVNAYMNLSSTMRFFGTAVNHGFGEVEESGIILKIGDIYSEKKDRHIHGILK
ncbi:MAG TPA: GNAT family N-acetyltransferase [Bacteroidales bacterium]|nr:GNAT family N-acetyltransferase [Bacteroidales bacterium]